MKVSSVGAQRVEKPELAMGVGAKSGHADLVVKVLLRLVILSPSGTARATGIKPESSILPAFPARPPTQQPGRVRHN